jgi:hypothetical protein
MSTRTLTSPRPQFRNGEEFLHRIGEVPMSRVVWDPLPGTAKTVAVFDGPTEEPIRIPAGDETLDGGNVVPGFTMSLTDVFDFSDFEEE